MGCSNHKNADVEDDKNKKNNEKKDDSKKEKKEKKEKNNDNKKRNNPKKDENKSEEEIEIDENKRVEILKKERMMHEYYFYPTKDIPKNKFIRKDIQSLLPSDFASKEKKNKDKQYLCFVPTDNKKDPYKFMEEEEESEENNPLNNDVYLLNQKMKKVKSVKVLKREEMITPFNYMVEFNINEDGIKEKKSNKDYDKHEYYDMYPNGEGYHFKNDDEPKEEKIKIKLPKKENNDKKLEEIKKNDVNDIANIINKELKENGLVQDNQKKAEDNPNDF